MSRPPLEKITSDKLDEFLRKFFIEHLEYDRIDNDPDAENPRSSEAWRMVIPVDRARPFAIAYQANLSTMERRAVSRLYIEKVVKHRDSIPSISPVLYGFTDGARLVFFSADTSRNRDDRFDINEETQQFRGVNEKLDELHKDKLLFLERLGKKIPKVDFLFDARILSADTGFKSYMHAVREQLMKSVVSNNQALASVVYYLLESPEGRESGKLRFVSENKQLIKDLRELHLELGMRLGDAIAAAVDTLILRYLMVRFLEAYHPDAMKGLLLTEEIVQRGKMAYKQVPTSSINNKQGTLFSDTVTSVTSFTDLELEVIKIVFGKSLEINLPKARKKAKGEDKQLDIFSLLDEQIGSETILQEEEKRSEKLGGDFYLADLGKAARAIEEALLSNMPSLGSALIQDFLGRISNTTNTKAYWEFRYEDLRPQTLQDYYESSLGTAVQLAYDENKKSFEIAVGESNRQRKELGAYYTDARLCRYMVEQTVKPIFDERVENLRKAVDDKDLTTTRQAFYSIVHLSICDPTMGSAPFLRAAFDYLAESTQYFKLCRYINECKTKLPDFYSEVAKNYPFLAAKGGKMDEDGIGAWELHILRQMLYGVDIDRKAVCIACQTFALSSMRYLKQGERFPSFFNLNLKLGNALISPVRPSDRPQLAQKQFTEIAKLIQLRRKARLLANDEKAYEQLAKIFKQIQEIKTPILQELVQEHVAPILDKFTEELLPFCWELEFPEVFFNDDGTLKENPGFDVVIGNPPWEAIKFNDNEFLRSIGVKDVDVQTLIATNKDVATAYEHYRESIEVWKKWISSEYQYEHQQGGRDRNKWRLATEISWKLTKLNGAMSLVVPGGIIADEGGFALKEWIFLEGEAGTFISFEKENNVFSGSQTFAVMSFRKERMTEKVTHLEGLVRAEQLASWPYMPLSLSIDLVKKISPEVLAIPSIQDIIDLSLLEKLYQHSLIIDSNATWHAQTVSYDYHMGNDKEYFRQGGNIPLLEGKSIEQYEVVLPNKIEKRVPKRRQTEPNRQYRIACADVAGTLDARRMLCSILPHDYATGDKLNCFLMEGDDAERLFLVGLLNSFVIEWRIRQLARSNNVKKFMLIQLPIPRPPKIDVESVASLVASLVTSDERFSDLKPLLNGRESVSQEHKRHEIKCLIDAEVAHLFGLTDIELKRVLEGFDKVPQETKDLVLKYFQEIAIKV